MGFVWKIMFLLKISWSHVYGKNPRVFWYLVKELDHSSLSSSMTNTAKPDGLGPYPRPSKSVQSRSPQGPRARTKWLTLSSIVPGSTLVSSLSFSMKGIRWPTAFFMTRADFITWGKYTVRHLYQNTWMIATGHLWNFSTNYYACFVLRSATLESTYDSGWGKEGNPREESQWMR